MPHVLEPRVQKRITVETPQSGRVESAGEPAGDFGDDYGSVSGWLSESLEDVSYRVKQRR